MEWLAIAVGAVVVIGLARLLAHRARAHRHRAQRQRLEPWLLAHGFTAGWGDDDAQSFERTVQVTGAEDRLWVNLHDDFAVVWMRHPLPERPARGESRLGWPSYRPSPISGDAALDAVLAVDADDGGPGLPLLLATPARRALLTRFMTFDAPPDTLDRRTVHLGADNLTANAWLNGDPIEPATLEASISALEAFMRGAAPALTGAIEIDLARAATDATLDDLLRRRAARLLLTRWPQSESAREVAAAVLDGADLELALGAGCILGDAASVRRRLSAVRADAEPRGRPLGDPWPDLLDRLHGLLAAEPVGDAPTIAHRGLRQGLWSAAARAGDPTPLLTAIAAEDAPAIRAELIELLAAGPMTEAVEGALIAALRDAAVAAERAAELLAARGGPRALRPLVTWRGDRPETPRVRRIEAGIARIRAAVDPALAGQLALSEGDGGGLTLADPVE